MHKQTQQYIHKQSTIANSQYEKDKRIIHQGKGKTGQANNAGCSLITRNSDCE